MMRMSWQAARHIDIYRHIESKKQMRKLLLLLLFVCSKMADETNLSSYLPVADSTREV